MLKSHSEINQKIETWKSRTLALLEDEKRRYKDNQITFEHQGKDVMVSYDSYISQVKTYFANLTSASNNYFSLDVNSLVNNIFTSLKMAEYRVGQRYEKGKMRDYLDRSNAPRGAAHLDDIMYNFNEFNIGNDDIYHNLNFKIVSHESANTSNGSSTKTVTYTRDLINSPIIDNLISKLNSEKERENNAFSTLNEWCYRGDDNFFELTQSAVLGRLVHVPDEKEIAYNLYNNGIKNFKTRGVTVRECEEAVKYFTPTTKNLEDIFGAVTLEASECIIEMTKDVIKTGDGTITMVTDSLGYRSFADSKSEELFNNLRYDLRGRDIVDYKVNRSQLDELKVDNDQLELFAEGRI